jgi:hypothetical protein
MSVARRVLSSTIIALSLPLAAAAQTGPTSSTGGSCFQVPAVGDASAAAQASPIRSLIASLLTSQSVPMIAPLWSTDSHVAEGRMAWLSSARHTTALRTTVQHTGR